MATPKKAKKELKVEEVATTKAPAASVPTAAPVAAKDPKAKHACAKCGTMVAVYEVSAAGKGYCSTACFVGRNG